MIGKGLTEKEMSKKDLEKRSEGTSKVVSGGRTFLVQGPAGAKVLSWKNFCCV